MIEDIWANRDREHNIRCLVRRLQRIDKEMAGEARELFAAFIADGDLGRYARELPGKLHREFTGTMKLLRDPSLCSVARAICCRSNVSDRLCCCRLPDDAGVDQPGSRRREFM